MSPEVILDLLGEAPWQVQIAGLAVAILLPYLTKNVITPALRRLFPSGSPTPDSEGEEEDEEVPNEDQDVKDLRTTLRSVLSALQRAQTEIDSLNQNLQRVSTEKLTAAQALEEEREKNRDLTERAATLTSRVSELTEEVRRAQTLLESLAAGRTPTPPPPPTQPPTPPAFWTQ